MEELAGYQNCVQSRQLRVNAMSAARYQWQPQQLRFLMLLEPLPLPLLLAWAWQGSKLWLL